MANNVFYTSPFLLTLIIGHLLRGRRNQKFPGIGRGVLTSTPWNDPLSVDPSSELGASSEEALPRLCQLWKRFKTRVVSQFLSHWGWHKLASKRCSALWDCWEALPAADKTNCGSTADFLIPISVCGSVHCQNYTGTGLSNMKDTYCLVWNASSEKALFVLTDGIALSWACAVHVSQAEQLASEHWPLVAEEFGCAVGWEQMPQ